MLSCKKYSYSVGKCLKDSGSFLVLKHVFGKTLIMSFLPHPQEIDAITTQPSAENVTTHPSTPASAPPKPDTNTQQSATGEGQNQQSTEFEYNTQDSLAGGKCAVTVHTL